MCQKPAAMSTTVLPSTCARMTPLCRLSWVALPFILRMVIIMLSMSQAGRGLTSTGVSALMRVPVPSWPKSFHPHASKHPLAVINSECRDPAATLTTSSSVPKLPPSIMHGERQPCRLPCPSYAQTHHAVATVEERTSRHSRVTVHA